MTQSVMVSKLRLAGGAREVEIPPSSSPAARSNDVEQLARLGAVRKAEQEIERIRLRVLACC